MGWVIEEYDNGTYKVKHSSQCKYSEDECMCPGHPHYRSVNDVRNNTDETIYGECVEKLCPLRSDNFE